MRTLSLLLTAAVLVICLVAAFIGRLDMLVAALIGVTNIALLLVLWPANIFTVRRP